MKNSANRKLFNLELFCKEPTFYYYYYYYYYYYFLLLRFDKGLAVIKDNKILKFAGN